MLLESTLREDALLQVTSIAQSLFKGNKLIVQSTVTIICQPIQGLRKRLYTLNYFIFLIHYLVKKQDIKRGASTTAMNSQMVSNNYRYQPKPLFEKSRQNSDIPQFGDFKGQYNNENVSTGFIDTNQSKRDASPNLVLQALTEGESVTSPTQGGGNLFLFNQNRKKHQTQSANPTRRYNPPMVNREELATVESRTNRVNSQIFESNNNQHLEHTKSRQQQSSILETAQHHLDSRPQTAISMVTDKKFAHHEALQHRQLQQTVNDLRQQVEQLMDFKAKYEKNQRQVEKLKQRIKGSENVCISQQSLIELQSAQIQKLKNKVKKYKRRVVNRDNTIGALNEQLILIDAQLLNQIHQQENNSVVMQSYQNLPSSTQNLRYTTTGDPINHQDFHSSNQNPFAVKLAQEDPFAKENNYMYAEQVIPEKRERRAHSTKGHRSRAAKKQSKFIFDDHYPQRLGYEVVGLVQVISLKGLVLDLFSCLLLPPHIQEFREILIGQSSLGVLAQKQKEFLIYQVSLEIPRLSILLCMAQFYLIQYHLIKPYCIYRMAINLLICGCCLLSEDVHPLLWLMESLTLALLSGVRENRIPNAQNCANYQYLLSIKYILTDQFIMCFQQGHPQQTIFQQLPQFYYFIHFPQHISLNQITFSQQGTPLGLKNQCQRQLILDPQFDYL